MNGSEELVETIGTTYQVGPGKPYADLKAVANQLKPGDVVEVYANGSAYSGDIVLSAPGSSTSKVTIRGMRVNGARPVLSGGYNTIEFQGDHYVFEGFDITGGSMRCVFHHAHDITIRDSVIHDCPNHGLLGAEEDSGSLTMEYTEVYHCGNGDRRHPVYMATDESAHPGAVFRMQHCFLHDQNGGDNFRTRAERTEIYYNWIEGGVLKELELVGPDTDDTPEREDTDVVGNVIVKKTGGLFVARVGSDAEGYANTHGRHRFASNTFILNPNSSASVLSVFGIIDSLEMHNNVFYRPGSGAIRVVRDDTATASYVTSGSGNWVPTGSTSIPSTWTGTIEGNSPAFVNVGADDVHLAGTSELINHGSAVTPSPAGHAFPSPLVVPLYLPPNNQIQAAGTALVRPVVGVLDIGAFEYGTASTPPPPAPQPPPPPPSGGSGGSTGGSGGSTGGSGGSTGGSGGSTGGGSCITASASPTWLTQSFASQSGTFTAEADVTPNGTVDAAVALAQGAKSTWKGLAAIVLFHPGGGIYARNGGAYTQGSITYRAGTSYHVRMVVNVAAHTYSAYVRPAGGSEMAVGVDLAFRKDQAGVSSLDMWNLPDDQGSIQVCNFSVH